MQAGSASYLAAGCEGPLRGKLHSERCFARNVVKLYRRDYRWYR